MNEFDIIRRYFDRPLQHPAGISLGIGDDAAVVDIPVGMQLALAMDTMVQEVHFGSGAAAEDIGWKALAVNLSDLAAMGAEPRWITCSLTLPQADAAWIEAFCRGLFELAQHYGIDLIGGDLCRGPLVITIQAHGLVPAGQALTRAGARPGDRIFVTGTLGDAGFALTDAARQCADRDYFYQRLHRPQPRVELGQALRGVASSAIDISDGLLADLQHVLDASRVGAEIHAAQMPVHATPGICLGEEEAIRLAATAGDDYELCITAAQTDAARVLEICRQLDVPVTCIGMITSGPGLVLQGFTLPAQAGYQHFKAQG